MQTQTPVCTSIVHVETMLAYVLRTTKLTGAASNSSVLSSGDGMFIFIKVVERVDNVTE